MLVARIAIEAGCKVGWAYYSTYDEALEASKEAENEARRKFALGYDFGWQVPGAISRLNDHPKYGDCWMVVVP